MGIKNRKLWGQVLKNLNVSANYTRILKSWSFNYFEEYILVCDCSHIEVVHRRRRSRAESGLVSLCYTKETPSQGFP